MIEGLKVDVTADEVTRLLEGRIAHHEEIAGDCEDRHARLSGISSPDPDDTEECLALSWPPYLEHLERRAQRHRDRAQTLAFLRDHVVAHEIYRLGEADLRALHMWPIAERPAAATRRGEE